LSRTAFSARHSGFVSVPGAVSPQLMNTENIMPNKRTSNPAIGSKSVKSRDPKQARTTGKTTKKAKLIALLSRKNGADVPSLSETLGWLPHTTRAALTGLRKAGYEITSSKSGNGKPSRYQIVGLPDADAA